MSRERPGLSSPDKLLWPEAGFSKADLFDYYDAVAERLLSAVADRPVTLLRHPDGVASEGFFQKDLPGHAPAAIRRFRDRVEDGSREVAYAVLADREGLRWCAQMAGVELHPWTSRTDRSDRPDVLVLDLDAHGSSVEPWRAARWVREHLTAIGLESRCKTSGKSGLHVLVPIERRYAFGEVRGLALAVARSCAASRPDELTVEMRIAPREGRLLIDWSRNARGQTTVAAWSPRATPPGTVAMPLDWSEVDADLDPSRWTLATAPDRGDAWSETIRPQRLEAAARALAEAGFTPVDVSPRGRGTTEQRLARALNGA